MEELKEIREDIILLRNLGNIPEEVELVLLRKINSIEKQLALCNVSNSIAKEYADFCVRCDRQKLPLISLERYIKNFC